MADDDDTTMLKETLPDGTRRVWYVSGQEYAATEEQRAEIVKGITEMHWQRPGTSIPMSPGLLLQELVKQLQVKWVAEWGYSVYPIEHRDCTCKNPEYCNPDCWATYSVVGIKVRQRRYWWTMYFLDVGIGAVMLIGDTTDAVNPAGSISVGCAMEWHDQCKGKFTTKADGAKEWMPCGCSCRHPHLAEGVV